MRQMCRMSTSLVTKPLRFVLDDDELMVVEPWWPAVLEHVWKDLVALYVENVR
jgi:hypothetical protein